MNKPMRRVFLLLLLFLVTGQVNQAVAGRTPFTLAPYFTNSMVLQRGMGIPVWGTAPAGTTVDVRFFRNSILIRSQGATAKANGTWTLTLAPMDASSAPGTLEVRNGNNPPISRGDVLIGDVWVLSGQSNINVMLKDCIGGTDAVLHSGDYPHIRLYLIPQTGGLTERWEVSKSTNTPDWSCVGFFFARALHNLIVEHNPALETGPVPIGLIQVAKNGSPIADWTTYGGSNNGRLYKEKIKPLQPFAIRGVIWYQGEDDGSRESTALRYYDMLPELIRRWSDDWEQDTLFFNYVQLPPIANRPTWAILRDAQVSTLDELVLKPPTRSVKFAMICTIDILTEPRSEIHPKDKEPVGERLALAALSQAYPDLLTNVVHSGPIRNTSLTTISGSDILVKFRSTDAKLVTDDRDATGNSLPPEPFLIAGANGIYYPATAEIVPNAEGHLNTVRVSNPSAVPNPVSVRYCWDSYPLCNLFNDDNNDQNGVGLPASPFQIRLP